MNTKKGKAATILSDYDRHYYKNEIARVAELFQDGQVHYTGDFYMLSSSFTNGDDGRLLRKVLRTLEHDGIIELIARDFNTNQWKLKNKNVK